MAKKKQHTSKEGKCLKDALKILAKSGIVRPGSADGEATYTIRLNTKGAVEGVDVHLSDKMMGEVLDNLTTP